MAIINISVLSGGHIGTEKSATAIRRAKKHGLVGLPLRSVSTESFSRDEIKCVAMDVPTYGLGNRKLVVAFSKKDSGLTYVMDKPDFKNLIK